MLPFLPFEPIFTVLEFGDWPEEDCRWTYFSFKLNLLGPFSCVALQCSTPLGNRIFSSGNTLLSSLRLYSSLQRMLILAWRKHRLDSKASVVDLSVHLQATRRNSKPQRIMLRKYIFGAEGPRIICSKARKELHMAFIKPYFQIKTLLIQPFVTLVYLCPFTILDRQFERARAQRFTHIADHMHLDTAVILSPQAVRRFKALFSSVMQYRKPLLLILWWIHILTSKSSYRIITSVTLLHAGDRAYRAHRPLTNIHDHAPTSSNQPQ